MTAEERASNLDRFATRADDYARYRPSYPVETIAAILDGFSDPVVADLGAGTGISARLLAGAGACVYAVEPNGAMRAAIGAEAGIHIIAAPAEASTLASASVDVVTAFQAYHWFDVDAVWSEIARITKPRARFAAVWNHRDRDDPLTAAYETIVDRYDQSEGCIDRQRRSGTVLDDARRHGWSDVRMVTARQARAFEADALLGFVRSCSYLPRSGPAYEAMAAECQAFFEAWARDGSVTFQYLTQAYLAERQ